MSAYHRPTDLTEALDILAAGPVCVAAGCTDLFPVTETKTLPGPVLDITAIDALRGITRDDQGWRIGAATTWSDVIAADLPGGFDGLKLAAREVGSVQIQNAGTVAGNLCTASPAGDGVPCLLTLDAEVELQSASATRVVPLSLFLTGPRQTNLAGDELVTAIHIPARSGRGHSHFLKLGARKYLVISIAMIAIRLELSRDVVEHSAIAVGACSPVATRLPGLEADLIGLPLQDLAARVTTAHVEPHLSPIDDIRADAGYRKGAATELIRRGLQDLAQGGSG